MRYYTTQPINGAIAFKCSYCEHTVTTLDFDSTTGNRRTQAAAAINKHAVSLHLGFTTTHSDFGNLGGGGKSNTRWRLER